MKVHFNIVDEFESSFKKLKFSRDNKRKDKVRILVRTLDRLYAPN